MDRIENLTFTRENNSINKNNTNNNNNSNNNKLNKNIVKPASSSIISTSTSSSLPPSLSSSSSSFSSLSSSSSSSSTITTTTTKTKTKTTKSKKSRTTTTTTTTKTTTTTVPNELSNIILSSTVIDSNNNNHPNSINYIKDNNNNINNNGNKDEIKNDQFKINLNNKSNNYNNNISNKSKENNINFNVNNSFNNSNNNKIKENININDNKETLLKYTRQYLNVPTSDRYAKCKINSDEPHLCPAYEKRKEKLYLENKKIKIEKELYQLKSNIFQSDTVESIKLRHQYENELKSINESLAFEFGNIKSDIIIDDYVEPIEHVQKYFGIYICKKGITITDEDSINKKSNRFNTLFIDTTNLSKFGANTMDFRNEANYIRSTLTNFIIHSIGNLYNVLCMLSGEGYVDSWKKFILIGIGKSGENNNKRAFGVFKKLGFIITVIDDSIALDSHICPTCMVAHHNRLLKFYPNYRDIQIIINNVSYCKSYFNPLEVQMSQCINIKHKIFQFTKDHYLPL